MIKTAYASSIGRVRKTNQDFVQVFKNKSEIMMAIVADGMGGHLGGDVASSMATKHLGHSFSGTDFSDVNKAQVWLRVQLEIENETILSTSDRFKDLHGMGTTVVMLLAFEDKILISHLGDSRAYLLRNNEFSQLTEDHSLVNELLKSGQITAEQAENHPQKNVITQTLGVSESIKPEFTITNPLNDDLYMLCSDGLTNSLSNEQIKEIIQSDGSLKQRCDALVEAANKFGGSDNITVCLAQFTKEGE